MRRLKYVLIAASLLTCVIGCRRDDAILIPDNDADVVIENDTNDIINDDSVQDDTDVNVDDNYSTDKDSESKIAIDLSGFGDYSEKWIVDKTKEILISEDMEVEFVDWVDADKTCLQIAIAYKEMPEDRWTKHEEDYFVFKDDIKTLKVNYDFEHPGFEHPVWDAPTFISHFEDVNFDGVDEIIIHVGMNGFSGMQTYSAYEYKDGEYVYFSAFDNHIYSYKIDKANETIICKRTSGDSQNILYTTVFKYENGDYVEIEETASGIYDDFSEIPLYMGFDYDKVDTKGLSKKTIDLFAPCAIYLEDGSDTANGDTLISYYASDNYGFWDFIFYFPFESNENVELVHSYDADVPYWTEQWRIEYEEWEYFLREVIKENNVEKIRNKLPNECDRERNVFYNSDDNCIYREVGAINWRDQHAYVREVKREGDAYIITYDLFDDFSPIDAPYSIVEVTIAEADNKYGFSLVGVDKIKLFDLWGYYRSTEE